MLWSLPDVIQQVRYILCPDRSLLKDRILPSRSMVFQMNSQIRLLGRTLEGAELSSSTPFPRALTGVKRTQHLTKGAQILAGLIPGEGVTAEG